MHSVSTQSSSSPSPSTRTPHPSASLPPSRLPAIHLRELEHISHKFRRIIVEGDHHHYVAVYAVARGGTWQRLYFMEKREYRVRRKPSSQPGTPTDKAEAAQEPGNQKKTSSLPRRKRERLAGSALKKHNAYRQHARKKDAFSKVSIRKVPPSRRLHFTLTSSAPLPDARAKIDEIVRTLARKLKNDAIFAIWVASPQQRGVEHFHVCVYVPGRGDLQPSEGMEIEEYVDDRWERYVDQHLPVQTKMTSPATELDARKVESYVSNQPVEAPEDDALASRAPSTSGKPKGKKTRMFGIVRRKAYEACVEIEEYVLPEHDLVYRIRRVLRNDVSSEVRSWSETKRFKAKRYQIEGRFHRSERVALQALDHALTSRYGTTPPNIEVLPPMQK